MSFFEEVERCQLRRPKVERLFSPSLYRAHAFVNRAHVFGDLGVGFSSHGVRRVPTALLFIYADEGIELVCDFEFLDQVSNLMSISYLDVGVEIHAAVFLQDPPAEIIGQEGMVFRCVKLFDIVVDVDRQVAGVPKLNFKIGKLVGPSLKVALESIGLPVKAEIDSVKDF